MATINGTRFMFVANENTSTVMMYDLSDPVAPVYHDSVFGGGGPANMTYLEMYENRCAVSPSAPGEFVLLSLEDEHLAG